MNKSVSSLDLVVGGAFGGIAASVRPGIVYGFVDAKAEIDKIGAVLTDSRVLDRSVGCFALVPGTTVRALTRYFEGNGHPWFEYARGLPNTLLDNGLAQERFCGYLAWRLAKEQGLSEFLESLYGHHFRRSNAEPGDFQARIFAGTAGATGGAIGREIARQLGNFVSSATGRTTAVSLVRLGAVTFDGLGSRTYSNTAASLLEDLDYVLSADQPREEVRYTYYAELPTASTSGRVIGTSKDVRDMLAEQLYGAFSSPEVSESIRRLNPNLDLEESGLGTVRLLQADWWHGVSPNVIVASGANHYCGSLARYDFRVSETAVDPSDLPEIAVETAAKQEYLRAPADLVDALVASDPLLPRDDFERKARRVRPVEATVHLRYANQRRLESCQQELAAPRTVESFIEALCYLGATVTAIDDKLRGYRLAHRQAEAERVHAETTLQRSLNVWYPDGFWSHVRRAFMSPATRAMALQEAIESYRNRAAKAAESKAAMEALEVAVREKRELFESYRNRPSAVGKRLTELYGQMEDPDSQVKPDWFRFAELDEVFSDLLTCRHNKERTGLLLKNRCLRAVTLKCLGAIVGCLDEPTPELILTTIGRNIPCYRGPYWGGGQPLGEAIESFLVLPPLTGGTFDEISRSANLENDHGATFTLAQAPGYPGGPNVLILRLYKPDHISELIPRRYFHQIQKMDKGRFFVSWEALMNNRRVKQAYDTLCYHHATASQSSEGVASHAA